MKRALIHIAILMLIFTLLGTVAGWVFIIGSLLLRHTERGRQINMRIKHGFLVWRYEVLEPWFKRNKDFWLFKAVENSKFFPWYGKQVVYVKAKEDSELSVSQLDVKDAIKAKDYKRALAIVNDLPVTAQTTALKQVISAKLS